MESSKKQWLLKHLYGLAWLLYMGFNVYWLFYLDGQDKSLGFVVTLIAMIVFWLFAHTEDCAEIIYHRALGGLALFIATYFACSDGITSNILPMQMHKLVIIAGANIFFASLLWRAKEH